MMKHNLRALVLLTMLSISSRAYAQQRSPIAEQSQNNAAYRETVLALFRSGARPADTSGKPLKVIYHLSVKDGLAQPEFVLPEPLPEIGFVDLSVAQVSEVTLGLLGHLPHLSRLAFDDTQISDRGAELIGGLPKLSQLTLRRVRMSRDAATSLGRLRRLEFLDIARAKLGSFEFLAQLSYLVTLNASSTSFNDRDLKHVAKLTRLESLNVMSTPVSEKGLATLPKGCITDLRFGSPGRHLTSATGKLIKSFRKLRHIELNYAGATIDQTGIDEISEISGLRLLGLGGSDLDDTKLRSVAKMTDLRLLWIPSTRISDSGVALLAQLPNLVELGLENHSNLSDAALQDLAKIESLRILTIRNTGISQKAVEALRARRPELKVLR